MFHIYWYKSDNCFYINLFYKTASGISAILENGAEGNCRFSLLFLWFASLHLVICVTSPRDLRLITAWNAISKRLRPMRWAPERWHFPAQNTIFVHHFPVTLTSKNHKLLSDNALTKSLKNALRWAKRFVFWKEAILNPPKFEYFLTILRAMRLLGHTLSSDVSIHSGGLVVKGIPASDLITHAVPLGAARAYTKHLQLFSICSEIEKVLISFSMFSYLFPLFDLSVWIYNAGGAEILHRHFFCLTMNA